MKAKFSPLFLIRLFVYSFISSFVYLSIGASSAWAADFGTAYDVQYAVSPAGTTIVTQKITLTNRRTNLYPKEFSIVLNTERVKSIIAYDGGGSITPVITQKDGKTQINVNFHEHNVGIGRETAFWLRFENDDIARHTGAIWEINIPGIREDEDIESYVANLQVPPTFGPNAYMWPAPNAGTTWNKEQLLRGGITAAYGTAQYARLSLSYFLENPTIAPKEKAIALPPDTATQHIHIQSLDPKPTTVTRDDDGNYLASYSLLPGQHMTIVASVDMEITLTPKQGQTELLGDESLYLQPRQYWDINDPSITVLAKTYTTPRAIYEYVVSALTYDYKRVGQTPIRKGAKQVLAAPDTAVCMEFTDLFIAISRAAGIPAREVVGYAYTTNAKLRPLSLVYDVLHSWPEYYDREHKIWVPVDPTWANTTGGVNYFDKLDFNHIVFAIHGTSSDSPAPAGFYRPAGKTAKDARLGEAPTRQVEVQFLEKPPSFPEAKVIASIQFPKAVRAGSPHKGSVMVANTSGTAAGETTLTIQSTPVDLAIARTIPSIPPLGSIKIPFNLILGNSIIRQSGRIVATVNHESTHHVFEIQPYTYYSILPFVGLGIVVVLLIGLTIGYHKVWKRSKHK